MPLPSIPEQGTTISPEQLLALLDSPRTIFLFVNSQGTIQFASASVVRLLGFAPGDLVGNSVFSLMHPRDAAGIVDGLSGLSVRGRGGFDGRCRLAGADGSWRWFEAAACDCSAVQGIGAIVLQLQDITELHRMEAERQVNSEIVHALNQ